MKDPPLNKAFRLGDIKGEPRLAYLSLYYSTHLSTYLVQSRRLFTRLYIGWEFTCLLVSEGTEAFSRLSSKESFFVDAFSLVSEARIGPAFLS